MQLNNGDIIEKRNIIFKDTYTRDTKYFHPAVIMITKSSRNDYFYYLTLTSNTDRYFNDDNGKKQYYMLSKKKCDGIRKSSLVNLQNIYRDRNINEKYITSLSSSVYREVVKKLSEWQENCDSPDEFYGELICAINNENESFNSY